MLIMRALKCLGTLSLLITVSSCLRKNPLPIDTACPTLHAPVCGSDQKTYSNSCQALKQGISRFSDGECQANNL